MYKLAMKMDKKTFYFLSFTWGFLYTFLGFFIASLMLITFHRPHRWGWSWYFETGRGNWGGMEWGMLFLKDKNSTDLRLKNHEFGHAFQNCILGPFMPLVVSIPSAIRYWSRRAEAKAGHQPKTGYDDIWFEGQATRIGTDKMKQINENKQA